MADNTRKFVLEGKVDSIKSGVRDVRKELRELQRVQREGGKLTDEQKKRVGDLKDVVANLNDESAKYRAELKKLNAESKRAARASTEAKEARKKMAMAILAAGVATLALAKAVGQAVKAQGEQVRTEKALAFAFQSSGQTRAQALKSLSAAQAEFAKNQRETIFGDEEQAKALATIIRTTGDTAGATKNLTKAMDLATLSGEDLTASAKRVAEAVTGDLGPLKELGILTAEQVTQFNKIKDPAMRAAAAFEEVARKSEGARFEVGETAQTIAELGNDFGDLEQAGGKLALALGELATSVVTLGDSKQSAMGKMATQTSTAADNILLYWNKTDNATKATDAFLFAIEGIRGPFADFSGAADEFGGRMQTLVDNTNRATKAFKKMREARPFESSDRTQAGVQTRTPKGGLSFKTTQDMAGLGDLDDGKGGGGGKAKSADEEGGMVFTVEERDRDETDAAKRKKEHKEHMDREREKLDAQIKFNKIHAEEGEQRDAQMRRISDDAAAKAADDEADALEKRNAAIAAGAGAAQNLAGEFIDSEIAKAGIAAAMETALALAAYPDVAGMIAHGSAAAQFAIIAGKQAFGGGGGGGKKVSGGGGGGGSAFNPSDLEAGGAVGRGVGTTGTQAASPVVINVAFRSVSKPSPEESRVIADAVADEMRTRA